MAWTEANIRMIPAGELPGNLIPFREGESEKAGILCGNGRIYLLRGAHAFCCEDMPEGREILLSLAAQGQANAEPACAGEALLRMLDGCGKEEAIRLTRKFGLRLPESWCMVSLQESASTGSRLVEAVQSLAPMETRDLLVDYGPGMAVLIKQGDDLEEIRDFTLALLGTLESETGLKPRAGMGEVHSGTAEWPEGLREALSAIRIGTEFRLKEPLQVYRHQLLERLLNEIPSDRRQSFRRKLFQNGETKALSQETMETVEMFFASDLNLSDTARQMFLHRNTLTYRLDKIRRETGLDLRKFNDAVVFRVLMALPESGPANQEER